MNYFFLYTEHFRQVDELIRLDRYIFFSFSDNLIYLLNAIDTFLKVTKLYEKLHSVLLVIFSVKLSAHSLYCYKAYYHTRQARRQEFPEGGVRRYGRGFGGR